MRCSVARGRVHRTMHTTHQDFVGSCDSKGEETGRCGRLSGAAVSVSLATHPWHMWSAVAPLQEPPVPSSGPQSTLSRSGNTGGRGPRPWKLGAAARRRGAPTQAGDSTPADLQATTAAAAEAAAAPSQSATAERAPLIADRPRRCVPSTHDHKRL